MDPSTILSALAILMSAYTFYLAFTPPRPEASGAVKVENRVKKLIPVEIIRTVAFISKNMVFAHCALELYALFTSASDIKSICPSSALSRIYLTSSSHSGSLSTPAILSLSLVIAGGTIRELCHRELGKFFTWETSIYSDHRLIRSGPYNYVRHPSYTGMVAVTMGYLGFLVSSGGVGYECIVRPALASLSSTSGPSQSTALNTFGILYLAFQTIYFTDLNVWLLRRSFVEDGLLKKKFGKEWEEWAREVRWNAFPYVM